jgi:hypothetical protein
VNVVSAPPQSVLASYGLAFRDLQWVAVQGGFSGALIWRGEEDHQARLALKRWPSTMSASRLREIHGWLGQAARLPFVPKVVQTLSGSTLVTEFHQLFDVTSWLPGSPCNEPTVAEVEAACEAVAQLHSLWPPVKHGRCPGLLNRLRVLSDWLHDPTHSALRQVPEIFQTLIPRTIAAVNRQAHAAFVALEPWAELTLPLQPCLRDLRGEHILFSGSKVTGIVDYGAMAVDYPAVDLARLLCDLAANNAGHFTAGLAAYHRAGGQLNVPGGFVQALCRSGAVCSLIGWFVRFSEGIGPELCWNKIASRIEQLINQLESFDPV